MSNSLKSSDLIKSIKRRAMVPNDQRTFTDEEFLDIMNEEIKYFEIPELLNVHEEFLVRYEDFDIEEGKFRYAIPYRAIGNKLRDVAYIEYDIANPTRPIKTYELTMTSLEDLSDYNESTSSNSSNLFYVENNEIVLVDQLPVTSGKLRMYFYLKPNNLVTDSKASIVQAIDRNTGIITVSNFLSDFATLPKVDFIAHNSPNKIMNYDITPLSVDVNNNLVTFTTTDIPDDLIVGDYLNLAGQTIVPQLPEELHAIVAQRAAVSTLESLGDAEGMARAQARLDMMTRSSKTLIDNRVEGAPQKIKPRYGAVNQAVLGGNSFSRRGK